MADILENAVFTEIRPGVEISDYVSSPVEVKIVRLKAGTEVGAHSHSNDVVHLVLKGRVKIGDQEFTELGDYRCGGFEYGPWAVEDTIMLIIQPPGTTFEFVE